MVRTALLSGFAVLALLGGTAAAQDAGGFAVDPRLGATVGMSMGMGMGMPPLMPRQPVFANAAPRGAPPGATVTNPNLSRKELSQQAITRIRGDAGLLGGFNKGQALAASRQPPPEPVVPNFNFIDAPFIVNNVDSSLALSFGDSNVTQQFVVQGGEAAPDAQTQTQAPAPAPAPKPLPGVITGNGRVPPPGEIDSLSSAFGPLPHLPAALANGGIQFNNVGSAYNAAIGQGNTAIQAINSVQKRGKR